MIRISTYHWLPLADNMLPDILRHLREISSWGSISEIDVGQGALRYRSECSIKRENDDQPICSVTFHGKIDGQGFCQNVAELPPIHELSLSATLSIALPALREFLSQFIFDISPPAIRNKLAVLQEGIVSFSQFYADSFTPSIDSPAKQFLNKHSLAIIILNRDHRADMEAGLVVPELNLRLNRTTEAGVAVSESDNLLLCFTDEYQAEESQRFDGLFHKFAGLVNLVDCAARLISILKDTRDHVVPLRRKLAIALQRNTEEHFKFLTEMKKYLTYANVKLPVIQKVMNHLQSAPKSKQYKEMDRIFSSIAAINSFKTTEMLGLAKTTSFKPFGLISRLDEHLARLKGLYEEDEQELHVLSNEASEVLQGSLSAESVKLSIRRLDTEQASLELDRAAKNRANALKILSLVLSASTGAVIAEWMGLRGPARPSVALAFSAVAWVIIEWYIRRKGRYYRLVVPLNWTVPRDSLFQLQKDRRLERSETNGSRRIRTWQQKIHSGYAGSDDPERSITRLVEPNHGRAYRAKVTVDYEQRGFLHSVTVEIEADSIDIDSRAVLMQMLSEFARFDCVSLDADRESPLVDAFAHLDLFIDASLPSINWILGQGPSDLRRVLLSEAARQPGRQDYDEALEEYTDDALDVIAKAKAYREWLAKADQHIGDSPTLGKLLGKSTLAEKLAIIATLESTKHEHTRR